MSKVCSTNITTFEGVCGPARDCDADFAGELLDGDLIQVCVDGVTGLKSYTALNPCLASNTGGLSDGDSVLVCNGGVLEQKGFSQFVENVTTMVPDGSGGFNYINEDGDSFNLPAGAISTLTPVVTAGNTVAVHNDGNGNLVNIQETVTTMVPDGLGGYTFTNEAGTSTPMPAPAADTSGTITDPDPNDGVRTISFPDGTTSDVITDICAATANDVNFGQLSSDHELRTRRKSDGTCGWADGPFISADADNALINSPNDGGLKAPASDLCTLPTLTQAQVDAATTVEVVGCVDGSQSKFPVSSGDNICTLTEATAAQLNAATDMDSAVCVDGTPMRAPYPWIPQIETDNGSFSELRSFLTTSVPNPVVGTVDTDQAISVTNNFDRPAYLRIYSDSTLSTHMYSGFDSAFGPTQAAVLLDGVGHSQSASTSSDLRVFKAFTLAGTQFLENDAPVPIILMPGQTHNFTLTFRRVTGFINGVHWNNFRFTYSWVLETI